MATAGEILKNEWEVIKDWFIDPGKVTTAATEPVAAGAATIESNVLLGIAKMNWPILALGAILLGLWLFPYFFKRGK